MIEKPSQAGGYDSNRTALIRRACLEISTRLGDYSEDLCVVGGMVPSLLVDMRRLSPGAEAHVGTNDLDLALSVTILNDQRYEEIAKRLRQAGFTRDSNQSGRPTSHRWQLGRGVLVDFLISPSAPEDKGGRMRNLVGDFAAVITPGLHLAFIDRESVRLEGESLFGGTTSRQVSVCGPGAFVVLKSLAFKGRGENKDAYDLWYVLANRRDCAARLRGLMADPAAKAAIQVLEDNFAEPQHVGPLRAAQFLHGDANATLQADFAGLVRTLLAEIAA